MLFPVVAQFRKRRGRLKPPLPSAAPPPPPSGAHVVSVHYDPDTGYVVWRFDSIILTVVNNPLPFLAIAGFEGADWDGYLENELFTYFYDSDGNPPGAGDLWTAVANSIVQTEQGGVLAGSGTMT